MGRIARPARTEIQNLYKSVPVSILVNSEVIERSLIWPLLSKIGYYHL